MIEDRVSVIRPCGFGATIRSPTAFGPLILDDAGTVAHVTFNGSALVDSRGNAWTQNGTVPQVAKSGRTPAGAGAFSDANYYSLGAGSDVLDFAGDFSIAVVYDGSDTTANHVFVSNGAASSQGYYIQNGPSGAVRLVAFGSVITANAVVSGVNVACAGASGANGLVKLNLGSLVSGALTGRATDSTHVARIGRYDAPTFPYTGRIYEVWFSTTTASDALFTEIANRVKSRAGVTAW